MASLTETDRLCDLLVGESDIHNQYSRDKVTIATPSVVVMGEVMGKVTASGSYVPIDFDATDGSETAAGIVIHDYDATDADVEGVVLSRDAVVRESALVWPTDATAAQIAGALDELEAKGIIARPSTGPADIAAIGG
jgi:hypothetical protein